MYVNSHIVLITGLYKLQFLYYTVVFSLKNTFKAIEKQCHTSTSNHRVMIHDASQCISPLPQTPTQLSSTVHSEISLLPCSLSQHHVSFHRDCPSSLSVVLKAPNNCPWCRNTHTNTHLM